FPFDEGLLLGAYGVVEEVGPSIGAVGLGVGIVLVTEFAEFTGAAAQAVEGLGGGDVEVLGDEGGGSGGTDQVARAAEVHEVGEGAVEKRFAVDGLLKRDGGVEVLPGERFAGAGAVGGFREE